jgi:hypothetical protein
MRSATDSASSWSCVTMMVVTPSFCCSARISCRSRTRSSASSADSGSSSSSRPGEVAMARASAMRCCWPPESCAGYLPSLPGRPTSLSSSVTRARCRRAASCGSPGRRRRCRRRQVGKQRVALEHDAVVALRRRQPRDVAAGLQDLAGGLHLQAGDDAQQGRLAAARGPEEADELAAAMPRSTSCSAVKAPKACGCGAVRGTGPGPRRLTSSRSCRRSAWSTRRGCARGCRRPSRSPSSPGAPRSPSARWPAARRRRAAR